MLQQTQVATVVDYFNNFIINFPTVVDLAYANKEEVLTSWAGLGYYSRARNLHKSAKIILSEYKGIFPTNYSELMSLPGIGESTAGAILSLACNQSQPILDGNVKRVLSRYYRVTGHYSEPKVLKELWRLAKYHTPSKQNSKYTQAVMDLGATICTPRNPACGLCPWRKSCAAWENGTAAELPKKAPKKRKPTRHGIVYLARRIDGAWLLEQRPDSGLLGGMLGWPGSDWGDDPSEAAPIRAEWKTLNEEARHTFTHFHLRLTGKSALVPLAREPSMGMFIEADDFDRSNLPTVMRKAYDLVAKGKT